MQSLLAARLNTGRDDDFAAWAQSRRQRLVGAMDSLGLDALWVRCRGGSDPLLSPLLPVSFSARSEHRVAGGTRLLTRQQWGFRPDSPWEVEEARSLGLPSLDPRRVELAPEALWTALSSGTVDARLGFVGFDLSSSADEPVGTSPDTPSCGIETVHLGPNFVTDRLRAPSPMEREEVDRVCAVNDRAMLAVARLLVEAVVSGGELWLAGHPLTVGRLRRAAREEAEPAGLSFPEGCLVSAGADAANPHDQGRDAHRVKEGEPIVVDLFPRGHLYSDMTRTFLPGGTGRVEALDRAIASGGDLGAAIASVVRALAVAEGAISDQLSVAEQGEHVAAHAVQQAVQDHFEAGGWPVPPDSDDEAAPGNEGFVHGLGHGVGYGLHQAPWFSRDEAGSERGQIRPGEAFTLEPGLYRPGSWGVRIEDVYRIEPVKETNREDPESSAAGVPHRQERPLRLRRLTASPRCSDPAQFLYEFARRDESTDA